MTHMHSLNLLDTVAPIDISTQIAADRQARVVVVSDNPNIASVLDNICAFLGFGIEVLGTDEDVAPVLRQYHPMAVIAELDGRDQDGCHVMMLVADYDPSLPILMLTGTEPGMAGAVDAIQELYHLTAVTQTPELPAAGGVVDFLFKAGRRGDCVRMMPA